jgi:hypothetical protein
MAKKAPKPLVCLVCWNADLAASRAAELVASGFRVHLLDRNMSPLIGTVRDLGADAVVIDLDRLPSHGREVGIHLRSSKSTRHLPLVYMGGLPEKLERVRNDLPDATYAAWSDASAAIQTAIAQPVAKPVRPAPMMERSTNRDLASRLGVMPGVHVVAWGEAEFLRDLLGDLPEGVEFGTRVPSAKSEAPLLWLCAVRTLEDVDAAFDTMVRTIRPKASGWIIHPKQSSRIRTDFNQNDVRDVGLAHGWVDFKVCAVDQDWSGLKFAPRRKDQAVRPHMMKRAAVRSAAE